MDLVDVMGDVPLLAVEPVFEEHFSTIRVFERVGPCRLREADEETVRHFAQPAHNLDRFAGALMEVAKRIRPADRVQLEKAAAGLGDERAALHVTACFTVRKMMNDFVDAPAVRRRAVEPHLLGKRPQRRRE